jgi:hypothetical protein
MQRLSPATTYALYFSMATAAALLITGLILSFWRGRPHPLLLVSISAASFSWIEAPYDWAMYAQFPPALPRMPAWWPLNLTWGGGVPQSVPVGYMSYFGIPALAAVGLALWMHKKFNWRRPQTLLTTGLITGFLWAFLFNGIVGAELGVFHYGRVIAGLAIRPATVQQYPLYDALAMGVQIMIMAYLLGRTDRQGRTIVDAWADRKTKSRLGSALLSIAGVAVIGNLVYLSVFAPHLATKLLHLQTIAPAEQLYPGVPNQPL